MLRSVIWGFGLILAFCAAGNASDIHRVVTGLDANYRSIALFDSVGQLRSGASGIPSLNLWSTDSYPPAGQRCSAGENGSECNHENYRRQSA
jgi:hypothetical protein